MAITPADIESMTFSEAKKHGYSTEEVDAFLDQVSTEVDAMLKKIADLKGRLNNSEQQLAAAQAQVAQLQEQQSETMAAPAVEYVPAAASGESSLSATERQISQVLIVAQQSADKIVSDARANAETIRSEADQKAREVIRQALAEKQSELDEIDRLKQSREEFRNEYKKLLQHFIDDADSVFPQRSLVTPNGSAAASVSIPEPQAAAPTAGGTVPSYQPAASDTNFSDLD